MNPDLLARLWARRAHKSIRERLPQGGWRLAGDTVVYDDTTFSYPYNGREGVVFVLHRDGTVEYEEYWNSSYWNGWVISPSGESSFYGDNPCARDNQYV